jgi:hypothetical protein
MRNKIRNSIEPAKFTYRSQEPIVYDLRILGILRPYALVV